MTRDELIDKLKKVYALAERGEKYERDAAERRLKTMMQKYGITMEELEDASEEEEKLFFYKIKGSMCEELFIQVAAVRGLKYRLIGLNHQDKYAKFVRSEAAYLRKKGDNVVMVCTAVEFIEVTTMYEVLQQSLEKNLESFFYAFVYKNDLFARSADPDKEMTEDEMDMLRRAMGMADSIDKADYGKKMLIDSTKLIEN